MRIVQVCKPAAVVVREVSKVINDTDVDAITVADTTFLLSKLPPGPERGSLLRHEAIHVEQNARMAPWWAQWLPKSVRARLGAPRQTVAYLKEWKSVGYWHNKYEIEARAAE